MVHALGLIMAFATLWMIQSFTHAPMPIPFIAVLSVLCVLDVVTQVAERDIAGMATGLAIFAWVVIGRWAILPAVVKSVMPWLLCGLVLLLALFINEDWNCRRMQEAHPFPYHAVIEVLGEAMFIALALMWLACEAR